MTPSTADGREQHGGPGLRRGDGWGRRLLAVVGWTLLWLIVALCLAATIVPRFLDRIYYRGIVSDHFDGARFFNPDGEDTAASPNGRGRGSLMWAQATGSDGRPPWPDTVAVAQAKPAARIDGDAMVATWVGHATMLVQTQGLNILTDPIWSDAAGPFGIGPTRVARPGIAFDDLPKIDLIVVSHNHYDHMDLSTLKRLWDRDRPRIVTSLGNDALLRAAGIESSALDWDRALYEEGGALVSLPAVAECPAEGSCLTGRYAVHVLRSHHWTSRWFTDRNRALWSSFVVELPGGNVFFAGDTGLGDGAWADEAARFGPVRLALLPIGAFRFVPGQMAIASHIGPVDAVDVYRRLGATRGIPIHWGTFRLSYEGYDTPPKLLAAATRCTGQAGFAPVAVGVPVVVGAYAEQARSAAMSRAALLKCLDTAEVRWLK